MISNAKFRKDIQVIRGLAVLAVVLFHAKESLFSLGYLGVDVFFVISGFVVTPLILKIFTFNLSEQGRLFRHLSELRKFYFRRFYRLAPALASTLIISAFLIFLFGSPHDHKRFAQQGISTLLLAGNFGAYRYSGDYFYPNPNPLIHTWSLSVEEQIYISLPLIMVLALYGRIKIKKITGILFLLITTISFILFLFPEAFQPIYSWAGIKVASSFLFYSPISRIWQFTLGGLGFLFLEKYQDQIRKISKKSNLTLSILLIIILFSPINLSLKTSSTLASFITLAVIIFRSLDSIPKYLFNKFQWLGDRSYSIYLVHMPLIYIAKYSLATKFGGSESRAVQSIIAVIASLVFGAISYSKIENLYRNNFQIRQNRNLRAKNLLATFLLTFAIPLTLFVAIEKGGQEKYWGLDRNLTVPLDAGNLDPKCNRDVVTGGPCVYKQRGSIKTVLLIGDSHARHISQAVIDSARNQNWNSIIWTLSGCNFQLRIDKMNEVSDDCINRNKEIVKWLKINKGDVVIVSQYVKTIHRNEYLKNALSRIQTIVPNVLIVENNPIFPDEKDFMVQRPLVMAPYKPPKVFERSMMQLKDVKASNQLANWARDNGINTINFDNLFCDIKFCSRYSETGWLYRDVDHFSALGANLTIPQISEYLNRL